MPFAKWGKMQAAIVSIALAVLAIGSGSACARLTYSPEQTHAGDHFLLISGEIETTDDLSQFVSAVQASGAKGVLFNSPGGNPYKAMELGRLIRSKQLATVQHRSFECASACSLAFMGGSPRFAQPGSIGVHRSSFSEKSTLSVADAVSVVQQMTADLIAYMTEMGVDPALLQLALSYDSDDIRYLSGSEMERFHLTTTGIQPSAVLSTQTEAATTPAPSSAGPAVISKPDENASAVIGTPEKMFLYEERLGQTSPTAIEGSVTWTAQEETVDDNGRPLPTIEGNIWVPERRLNAIITFKLNTDPSLPASHAVELVFSLLPNFKGGAIESVERIAMKATEQERGDALIGVPAKISDDFHVVALNDYPDARETNIDLLKSRNWIDIPITYRNGQRALLTLNKGKTGIGIFNNIIAQWAAMGDVTSNRK